MASEILEYGPCKSLLGSCSALITQAGFSLYQRYKSQFQKLLHIIARHFLSSLKEGGSESRSTKMSMVKMSIRNYVESSQFMKEPEGWRLRDHLESNEFWLELLNPDYSTD